jgi:hypothetical protein
MKLSNPQKEVLQAIRNQFPLHHEGEREEVIPRGKFNPATENDIEKATALDKQTVEDAVGYLVAMGLVMKTYRYGTKEYGEQEPVAGRIVRHLLFVQKPEVVDPADPSWGLYCYQITSRGLEVLKEQQNRIWSFLADHYGKVILPVAATVLGGLLLWYLKLR